MKSVVLTDNMVVVSGWHIGDRDFLMAFKDAEARRESRGGSRVTVAKVDLSDLVRDLLRWVRGVPEVMWLASERVLAWGTMNIPGDMVLLTNFPDCARVGICDRGSVHVPGVEAQRCGAHKGEGREQGEEQGNEGGHGKLHYGRIGKGDRR